MKPYVPDLLNLTGMLQPVADSLKQALAVSPVNRMADKVSLFRYVTSSDSDCSPGPTDQSKVPHQGVRRGARRDALFHGEACSRTSWKLRTYSRVIE